MSTENWKEIPGYNGRYYVSDLGRVKSVDTMVEMINRGTRCKAIRHGCMLKLHKCKKHKDYLCVHLFKNGIGKYYSVHRLVAQAFIPNPEGKPQVNHKDENPANNAASNLEWATAQENSSYGSRPSKYYKRVRMIGEDGRTIKIFPSLKDAAAAVGVKYPSISAVCHGRQKTVKGYRWAYV